METKEIKNIRSNLAIRRIGRDTEIVTQLRTAVSMLKRVSFDDECEPSFKRAWRRAIKSMESTLKKNED